MKRFWKLSVLVGCILCCLTMTIMIKTMTETQYVNVYDWYGVLPRDVLSDFEKDTGIKVHYDVFDNNEMVEAKLLAQNSGYDVVFPTLIPYAARQLRLGVYQKIDKTQLLHWDETHIAQFLIKQMESVDPELDYFLPYYWGTVGIAFDEDTLGKLIPGVNCDGYDLLFNRNILEKVKNHGVSLLQEAVDVFHPAMTYLGLNSASKSLKNLLITAQFLAGISPYIRRFSSSRFITDLIAGEICIAQSWSGEAIKAIEDAQKVGRHIRYIIPKEGSEMWIDCIAIPKGAPHPKNAHVFIDYLLRPDVSAKITNYSKMATMIEDALPYIDPKIAQNPLIFPDHALKARLYLPKQFLGPKGAFYHKVQDRIWTKLKVQRDKIIPQIETMISDMQKTHKGEA